MRAIREPKEKAAAVNAVRQTLLTAAAGAALLIGLGFTVRTFYLFRRGHLTDRYTRAIGQLASDKLEERVGGSYALEHLMRESAREHQTVVDVLATLRSRTRTSHPRRSRPCWPGGRRGTPGHPSDQSGT